MAYVAEQSNANGMAMKYLTEVIAGIGVVVAVGALMMAYKQIEASREIQREASARDAYKEYLKLAIEKPKLAIGSWAVEAKQGNDAEAEVWDPSYPWFVSYTLFSAEQIFLMSVDDDAWHPTLKDQLCYHQTYLRSPDFQGFEGAPVPSRDGKRTVADLKGQRAHYDVDFIRFMDESLKTCKE